MMDPYETLGISPDATSDEIKKAYRNLVKEFHPDKNQSEEAKTRVRLINAAYEILSDPVRRAHYHQPVYAQVELEEDPVEAYKREFQRKRWEKAQRGKVMSREKMTYKEQIRRIIKAAPHFPLQTTTVLSILFFAIPVLLMQMYDDILIRWVETKGVMADHQGVHERQRNGEAEYFYYIGYQFNAEGKQFTAFFERGFDDRASAENDLEAKLADQDSVTIWYDQFNPPNTAFEKEAKNWPVYLCILVLMILLLAYFRWLMLKYYALELTKENE